MGQGAFQRGRRARRTGAGRHGGLRPVVAVVLGALGVLALTGCTGADAQPEPVATEVVTASPPATPTPSPKPTPEPVTAPERPPEMDQPDEAGAVAAAEHVLEVYAYTFRSGDLDAWSRLSGQSCEFCDNTRADVERVYSAGGSYSGGELSDVFDIQVVGRDDQLGVFGVQVGFEISGGQEFDATGQVVDEFAEERSYILVELVPSTRGWVLVGGTALEGPVS